MPADEEVVHEHLHHAQQPFDKMVAGSMAIMAALLAVVSVLGQHFSTEELLLQQRASDQWSYYQAKSIRRFISQTMQDSLQQNPSLVDKYVQAEKGYRKDADTIAATARKLEEESARHGKEARYYHSGEVFLEIAIVFSSLAILAKQRPLFLAGVIAAFIGIAIGATAFFV